VAQVVPDAIDNSWGDAESVGELARTVTAEDTQLFYQVALNGKRDIAIAPDPRSGFEMILLRMVAFRPAAVIDDSLGPEDIRELPPTAAVGDAVKEVGTGAKKPPEGEPGERRVAPPVPVAVQVEEIVVTGRASEAATDCAPGDLAALTPGSWPILLDDLGLAGIVLNIASHCELRTRRERELEFILDEAHSTLFNEGHVDKIRLALENYFGGELSVSITPGALQAETPARRSERLRQERLSEAVAEIESDAQLQTLIARFDGELDRSSIAPLDS
jgi:DNA polymerase-3 subunit gamma/tau